MQEFPKPVFCPEVVVPWRACGNKTWAVPPQDTRLGYGSEPMQTLLGRGGSRVFGGQQLSKLETE